MSSPLSCFSIRAAQSAFFLASRRINLQPRPPYPGGDKAPNLDVEHGLKLLLYIQYLDLIIERLESLGLPKRQKHRRAVVK